MITNGIQPPVLKDPAHALDVSLSGLLRAQDLSQILSHSLSQVLAELRVDVFVEAAELTCLPLLVELGEGLLGWRWWQIL
jgi:hypothetical protein